MQKANSYLAAEFRELSQRIKGLESHIESFQDLKRFDEKAATALVSLARRTKAVELKGRNFGFFGITSTGKSSIINKLLGEELAEVGACETTTTIAPYQGRDYTLYDIPGRNDELSYFSMEYISFWKGLTGRVVVITATVKEMSKVLNILDAMSLTYDIVVNKFDNIDYDEREKCKEKIRMEVASLGLKGVQHVWFVSAKNPDQFVDWLKMVDYLTTGK